MRTLQGGSAVSIGVSNFTNPPTAETLLVR